MIRTPVHAGIKRDRDKHIIIVIKIPFTGCILTISTAVDRLHFENGVDVKNAIGQVTYYSI